MIPCVIGYITEIDSLSLHITYSKSELFRRSEPPPPPASPEETAPQQAEFALNLPACPPQDTNQQE